MDPSPAEIVRPRRSYWWCMAALILVLPAALVVQSYGSVENWRSERQRTPIPGEVGQSIDYAGAHWNVTLFARVPVDEHRTVVLTEFSATADQPQKLANAPCEVLLHDGQGREWKPTLFADSILRKAHPEAADLSFCSGLAFAAVQPGQPARMVASFSIPAEARNLSFTIAMSPALPELLAVGEPSE